MLPSRRRAPSSFLPLATTLLLLTGPSSAQEEERLPRKDLEADVRALVGHLEEAHPDPYLRGGGRIAFHRRVFETIDSLPREGMTRDDFYEHLLPLVASVRDGHTRLHAPRRETDEPGLPLAWRVIDTSLYVAAVFDPAHEELLGYESHVWPRSLGCRSRSSWPDKGVALATITSTTISGTCGGRWRSATS